MTIINICDILNIQIKEVLTILLSSYLVIILFAVLEDMYFSKISNNLILFSYILGILNAIFNLGYCNVIMYFCSSIVPLILLFPLFYFHMIGAGDIKLYSILGCFFGLRILTLILIFSIIIGGVISLCILFYKKGFYRFIYLKEYIFLYLNTNIRCNYIEMTNAKEYSFPFAVAIGLAVLLSLYKEGMIY